MEVREPNAKYLAKAGYKQTEVGVIPEDWQVGLLADLAQIRTGIAKNANASLLDPIEVPYLRVANVQDGYLDLSEVSNIKIDRSDLRRFSVLPNDVLMNEGGDLDKLGRGALWQGEIQPCVHQNHVFVVRCKDGLLPEFLNAWTSSPVARRYFLLAGRQTTNLASINKTSLGQLPVPFPTRAVEQQAIADALGDADALIESLDRLLAKKRQIKQGAMQALLTGEQRLPGFSLKWAVCSFDEVLQRVNVKAHQIGASQYQSTGSIPIVDQGKTPIAGYSDESERRFSPPKDGVIVFGDHTCIVKYVDFDLLVGADGTQVLIAKKHQCPRFHAYQLQYRGVEPTGYNRHFSLLKEREFLTPPPDEQTAIATVLSDMDAEITALEARLAKARMVKQGMMQVLLTGRIRLI